MTTNITCALLAFDMPHHAQWLLLHAQMRTYAFSVLWNFTVDPNSLEMPFFTVLALIKAGVPELWPVAARRRRRRRRKMVNRYCITKLIIQQTEMALV